MTSREPPSPPPTITVLRRPPESAQYAAKAYRDELAAKGLKGSMGRRGNPYDNAKAESFMKTLKVEPSTPLCGGENTIVHLARRAARDASPEAR